MKKNNGKAMKISACYIVKNEEKNLKRSIASIVNQVDEIVVVDTGSTDGTVQIAKNAGAKVYHFQWQDDFSAARNFALSKVHGDWLVLLDADEYFTKKTSGNIRQAVHQAGKSGGLLIKLVNYDIDSAEVQDYCYQLRVVRNQQGIHYEGIIHEELKLSDGGCIAAVCVSPKFLEIYHTGYSNSVSMQKIRRNLHLLQQAVGKGQSEESLARYFCDCYLGLGDMDKCAYYGWLDIRQGRKDVSFASRCNRVLLEYYAKRTDDESIRQRWRLAELSVEQYPEVPDFWAEYSECLHQAGGVVKAIHRKELFTKSIYAMQRAINLMHNYNSMEPSMLVSEHMENDLQNRLALFIHQYPQYATEECKAMLSNIMCEQPKEMYMTSSAGCSISKQYAEKILDEHKICFISCVNDEAEYAGCKQAISELEIPSGYKVEILGVRHAVSMAAGYQKAMESSNAKYKIYLHQDVFVINKSIIQDLLNIFVAKPSVGMIGLAGSAMLNVELPVWWKDPLSCYGTCYMRLKKNKLQLSCFGGINGTQVAVAAIDGLFMATQYDLPWRTDLFHGWHFYDVSQSREFINAGYQVVVPHQDEPWVIHDCGLKPLDMSYNENMEIFKQNYTW